jgi:hypothetical protein
VCSQPALNFFLNKIELGYFNNNQIKVQSNTTGGSRVMHYLKMINIILAIQNTTCFDPFRWSSSGTTKMKLIKKLIQTYGSLAKRDPVG